MLYPHRVWAEIDLDALTHNLGVIRKLTGPLVRTMMVVKADAYGHGAIAVAHHAVRCGVYALGVGDSHEALELRAAGIHVPILVLGTVIEDEVTDLLTNQIEIGLHSTERIQSLQEAAAKRRTIARVHVNLDTGMGRLGIFPDKLSHLLSKLPKARNLRITGIMSHLACADGIQNPFTQQQLEKFSSAITLARSMGHAQAILHVANSAALFTGMKPLYHMIRPGIAAYGILPQKLQQENKLKPVLSLKTQIIFLKDHPAQSSIGYNRRFITETPTRIATIPVGYNDGLAHRLSNRGYGLVRGQKAPIVGTISMDYTTIDIGHIPGAKVGDVVTLIGKDGDASITAEELAKLLDTIPYEITCAIGKRVKRKYLQSSLRETPHLPQPPKTASTTVFP